MRSSNTRTQITLRKTGNIARDISSFSTEHMAIGLGRLTYVKAVLAHRDRDRIKKDWSAIIATMDLPRGMKRHPSPETVKRWMKMYLLQGNDLRSLIPDYQRRNASKKT